MAKEIEISQLKNWGRPKKEMKLPAFLLPEGERDKLLHSKKHARGRPKTNQPT